MLARWMGLVATAASGSWRRRDDRLTLGHSEFAPASAIGRGSHAALVGHGCSARDAPLRLAVGRGLDVATVAEISAACAVLVVVIALQIRTITRSEHPNIRAAEALAFTIPVYLLLFAAIYFLMARALSTNFTESLTRTDALYFSVTVFTTTGFGDISAKSEAARLVVTLQMLLDLLLLGLVVRLS
jgi:voltage-gated potassium channel